MASVDVDQLSATGNESTEHEESLKEQGLGEAPESEPCLTSAVSGEKKRGRANWKTLQT